MVAVVDDQHAATVLVVDDEPNIVELVSAALRLSGFTVHAATNGARALAAVAHTVPDIVVVDVMLPDCDGFTLARQLQGTHGGLPVLFLTACGGVEDRIAGFVAGGADYLTKPFSLEELVLRLRAILRRTQPVSTGAESQPTDVGHLLPQRAPALCRRGISAGRPGAAGAGRGNGPDLPLRKKGGVVRTRIVGLAVIAALLGIVLFGVPLGAGALKYARNNERTTLLLEAEAAASAGSADLLRGSMPTGLRAPKNGTHLAVYVDRGLRIVGVGPQGGDGQVSRALHGEISTGDSESDLVVAVPVNHDSQVIGAVRAASPLSAVYRQVALVWLAMLVLAGLIIATVYVVARRQARRLEDRSDAAGGSERLSVA